jgi:photosystem II stability/assembly factor-like uncharacterized protein
LIASLAIFGLVPRAVWADDYIAKSIGPYGGAVYALAIDPQNPNVIYAGTTGVFKTTNAGSNWTAADSGITGMIPSLAIDPQNSATLYAATATGVFKSVDGGATWSAASSGMPTQLFIRSLAVDPQNSATIYAALEYPYGVYKTADAGANWSPANSGLPASTFVFNLAIDPKNSGTVYIGIGLAGVYKTSDGGASWSAVNSGLEGLFIGPLAVDPQNPSIVYAGWWGGPPGFSGSGVRKSTDGGANWRDSSVGLPSSNGTWRSRVSSLAIDPQSPLRIYAGLDQSAVYMSTNGGMTWIAANSGLPQGTFSVAVDPQNSGTVYAGHNTLGGLGVFKSTDGGSSWNEVNSGLAATRVSSFATDPLNPGTMYAALRPCSEPVCFTEARLFKTMNGGASWIQANSGLPPGWVEWLVVDPQNSRKVYTCINGFTDSGPQPTALFNSTDGGTSWHEVLGLKANCAFLAIDPRNSATLYAGAQGGVSKSMDEGTSWVDVGLTGKDTSVSVLAIAPQNPNTIYAARWSGAAYRSMDGGANWTRLALPAEFLYVRFPEDDQAVWGLAVDPQDSNTVYVSGQNGVIKSADAGASWGSVNSGLIPGLDGNLYVSALLIDPTDSNTLYAAQETGVFKSTSGARQWSQVWSDADAFSLGLDPKDSSTLYVTRYSRGIFSITFLQSSVASARR